LQAGFDAITPPGERSGRLDAACGKSGISILAELWKELEGIAKASGRDRGTQRRIDV
jgi:LDH2 family malate/lactate/ureidoglycolate dehydrogenase